MESGKLTISDVNESCFKGLPDLKKQTRIHLQGKILQTYFHFVPSDLLPQLYPTLACSIN